MMKPKLLVSGIGLCAVLALAVVPLAAQDHPDRELTAATAAEDPSAGHESAGEHAGQAVQPASGGHDAHAVAPAAGAHGHDEHPSPAAHDGHDAHGEQDTHGAHGHHGPAPSLLSVMPFVAILLCIAILPLVPSLAHWWHHNRNKLLISAILAAVTLAYYLLRPHGFHADPGLSSVLMVLDHAVLAEYIPFIILLFSLYTISGGIQLRGDLRATPITNTTFIGLGALMASFVGTTGASMLLIRPLLQINSERRHVKHTVIFFIFLVSNIGGCLLPIGDPPLFLGYLFSVPFFWTLHLWKEWLFTCALLLVVYWIWDTMAFKRESPADLKLDAARIEPLRIRGGLNFLWLLLVVAAVATIVPGQKLPGLNFVVPEDTRAPAHFLREALMLAIVLVAWVTTPERIRRENSFDFTAIGEVAVLFIGIFITMQAPVEILNIKGAELGLKKAWQFFWATGLLSSFLDNAPTYVVYFKTAGTLSIPGMEVLQGVQTATGGIPVPLLIAVSLGAVFMGANTYIGNGPNFMVKSIAEQAGVKMPSFFGYMVYSVGILIPTFLLVMAIFLL